MVLNCNYDGLIHFVADNLTHTGLSQISFHDYFLLYITISQRLPAQ